MKHLFLFIFFVITTGCTSTREVTFNIDSDPQGAVVESSGIMLCKTTPCQVKLESKARWFTGNCKSQNVVITATPNRKVAKEEYLMYSSKTVNPCQARDGDKTIFFNLGSETIRPIDVIETRTRNIEK